jgi:hypothetical protein
VDRKQNEEDGLVVGCASLMLATRAARVRAGGEQQADLQDPAPPLKSQRRVVSKAAVQG